MKAVLQQTTFKTQPSQMANAQHQLQIQRDSSESIHLLAHSIVHSFVQLETLMWCQENVLIINHSVIQTLRML